MVIDREYQAYCLTSLVADRYRNLALGCVLIDRLAGTRISTNIRTGNEEQYDTFGLIDAASIRRKNGLDGRLLWCEVKLSDWVFSAIAAEEVLTLHRDYFRLRKPLERRIYEIARKHCGAQPEWSVYVETLHKKSGSKSPLKHFRYLLKELARHDHLPDYSVELCEDKDKVIFQSRGTVPTALPSSDLNTVSQLIPVTFEAARRVAPGWDIYALEREWRNWITEPPHDPDRAFIGFCREWYKRKGPS